MRRRTVQPEIRSFVSCFDPLSRYLTEAKRRARTVSKSATFLATESVNSAPFKRGETKVQIFGKKKGKTLRQGANFWQGKVHNSSPISALLRLRHFRLTHSLSLSLSLYLSLSHIIWKAAQNLLLGSNRQESRSESWGVWYLLVLSRSCARKTFDVNVSSSWRHHFRAIWPGQRKSCVRAVLSLSCHSRARQKPCQHFHTLLLYDNA